MYTKHSQQIYFRQQQGVLYYSVLNTRRLNFKDKILKKVHKTFANFSAKLSFNINPTQKTRRITIFCVILVLRQLGIKKITGTVKTQIIDNNQI